MRQNKAAFTGSRLTHGMFNTPTWRTWAAMIQRCTNPRRHNFSYYGGRGIEVCERWRTFENFLADMGERPAGLTLERMDNEGNYEPSNCCWATMCNKTAIRRPRGQSAIAV